ncbi:MAG: OprO/OprP family phosphate-selective porin [Prolixibacteraceae bacterium]|nr:OprO/OprP family phosphate-selective porin [Prolixibacteraceae bacterium]
MKKLFFLILISVVFVLPLKSQSTDDILNVLVQKNLIAPKEADSIRAEAAIAAQANLAKVKVYPVNAGKKIALAGYTQVRYQASEQTGSIDGFDIRRARVDLKGSISPYWGYRFQFDLAGTPKLIDAYAELKVNDYLNITFGQAKIPFSVENLTSSTKLELIDRSQVVEALTARGKDVGGNQNGRDIGILLGGTILKLKDRPVVDYRLGVYNGSGINTADKDEDKDYAARLILYPVTGLAVSGAWYDGSRFVPEVKTGTVVTTPSKIVNRDRFGFDVSYDRKNFSLRSEYIYGKDDLTERDGYYLLGGYYLLQKKVQLVAKYDFYDADKAKADNASTWVVLGVNYNFNANTKLQINYTIKQEEGTSIDNNFANVQLQIGF